jgi:hypothetical protein
MKPEKQNLIHDLLGEDSRRETTLLAAGSILRRRRFWRAARPVAAALAAIAIAGAIYLHKGTSNPSLANVPRAMPETPPSVKVEALTDEQLLALFPNTPVGLASLADGKKRLVFPRPGDEEKFITRL